MNALRTVLPALALATFAGCHCGSVFPGSGVSATEERTLDKPYHRVMVADSLEVKLTDRDPGSLSITTDDNLIGRIKTEVTAEGVLKIDVQNGAWLSPSTGLTIEVSGTHVYEVGAEGAFKVSAAAGLVCQRLALSASGASRIELDGLTGDEAVIWASGASTVVVRELKTAKASFDASGGSRIDLEAGALRELDAQISGGSNVQLGAATTETATLNVSGGSQVALTAMQGVSGSASGGSRVTVRGNPAARSIELSGGSTVSYEE
jgi:hypothetical protein